MIKFKSIRLKGIGVHRQSRFDWQPGITVIRGRNLDARNKHANACGKSSLFTPFYSIIQGEVPFAPRKKQVKTLQGKAWLDFEAQGATWQVRLDAASQGWTVFKDGVDQEVYRKDDARKLIASLLPWNPALFRLVYMNSRMENAVLVASPTDRHAYFEQVFALDILDRLNSRFREQKSQLAETARDLNSRRASLPGNSTPDNTAVLEHRLADLEARLADARAQVTVAARYQARDKLLAGLGLKTADVASLERLLADKTKERADIETKIETARVWKEADELTAEIRTLTRRLQSKPIDLKACEQAHRRLERDLQDSLQAVERLDRYKRARRVRAETAAALTKMDPAWRKLSPAEAASAVHARLKQIKTILGLLQHADDCPLCRSRLTPKQVQALLTEHENEQARLGRHVKTLEELPWPACEPLSSDELKLAGQAVALKDELAKLTKKLETARADQALRDKIATLRERLPQVERPADLPPLSRLRETQRRLDETIERLRQSIRALRAIPADVERPRASLDSLNDTVSKLYRLASDTKAELQVARRNKQAWEEYYAYYRDNAGSLEDLPALEHLVTLTGPQGLRVGLLQGLMDAYLSALNERATWLLGAGKFEAVFGKRTMELYFVRRGQRTPSYALSGYESRAFEILHYLALTPLLPANLRCNTVILDEMEACLSPDNMRRFSEELIPALAEQVESVVVITPFSEKELYFPQAREVMVTLKDGVAGLSIVNS